MSDSRRTEEPETSGPAGPDPTTAGAIRVEPPLPRDSLAERPGDPPVVARLVVEIRSDGTRTVARGAMEDALSGERVALEARGTTPLALAASLAKTIVSAPMLARHAVRAMLQARSRKSSD